MQFRRWVRPSSALVTLLFLIALVACDGPGSDQPPATPTVPPPTATPTLGPVVSIPRTAIPAGWSTYQGPHFTIAYPPDWRAQVAANTSNPSSSVPVVSVYGFGAPNKDQLIYVQETLNPSPSTIQAVCQMVAFARVGDVTMKYSVSALGVRQFSLNTGHALVYQLSAPDVVASADERAQDDLVLGTFQPQYATSVCA